MSDLFHDGVPGDFIRRVFEVMGKAHWHTFQVLTKRAVRLADLAPRLPWPDNVWQGVSVESERYLPRIAQLRSIPAAVRFLSLEPQLGPLPRLPLHDVSWVIVGGESGLQHRPIEARWVREIRDQCMHAGVAFFFKQWGGRTPKAGGRRLDGREWNQMPLPLLRHGAADCAPPHPLTPLPRADRRRVCKERRCAPNGRGARSGVDCERQWPAPPGSEMSTSVLAAPR